MDMSMILGLALAGLIAMVSSNKAQNKKETKPKSNSGTEFVVRLDDGSIAVIPDKKPG